MSSTVRTSTPLLIVAVVLAAASCGGGDGRNAADSTAARVITADGSSTVFPVTEAVAEEFQRANAGLRVTVGSSGTGGGFQKFCRNETDLSNASRPIRPTETEVCGKAGIQYIELPVAYDGLAIVVHPKNTWATSMTVTELKKLWEPAAQGKVMKWNQIRSDWPDREIHLFGAGVDSGTFDYFTEAIVGKQDQSRGDYTSSEDDNVIVQGVSRDENALGFFGAGVDSGTFDYFTEAIVGKEDQSRGDYTSSEDDNVIVQGVSRDEGALGFFGYAYYEENKDKLKLVPIDDGNDANGAGAIAPSPETVKNGTYRPLSRPIFIYAKVQSLDRPEFRSFVDFYLTKGAELVREVGYIPLTDGEYGMVRKRLEARKTGSMYEGVDSHSQVTLEQRLSR